MSQLEIEKQFMQFNLFGKIMFFMKLWKLRVLTKDI